MIETITKQEAADRLIKRADRLIETDRDFVSAILLAGAAEDLLAELIDPTGKGPLPAARRSLAEAANRIQPGGGFRERMRWAYDWLRHSRDKPASDPEITIDTEAEARDILGRAIDNYWQAFGTAPREPDTLP